MISHSNKSIISFSISIVCRFLLDIRKRNVHQFQDASDPRPMSRFAAASRYTRDIVEELGDTVTMVSSQNEAWQENFVHVIDY